MGGWPLESQSSTPTGMLESQTTLNTTTVRRSIASRCGIGTELDWHGTTHRAHLRHSLSARHSLCICLGLCHCICLGLCLCICLFAFWYHTPCSFKTFFICQAYSSLLESRQTRRKMTTSSFVIFLMHDQV